MFPFLVVGHQHREIDLQREQGGRGADHDADRTADAARGEAGEHTCSRGLLFAEEYSGTPTLTAGIRLLTSMSTQIPIGYNIWPASGQAVPWQAVQVFMRWDCR